MKSDLKTYALIAAVVINLGLGLYNANDLVNFKSATEDAEGQIMDTIADLEDADDWIIASIADLEWNASSCEEKVEFLKEQILTLEEYDLWVDDMLKTIIEQFWVNEERLDNLELGSLEIDSFEPIYDSGWVSIDQDEYKVITTLENSNVFVYMIGRTDTYPAHQVYYGGRVFAWGTGVLGITINDEYGAKWYITNSNELKVHRFDDDDWWPEVRLIVWQLPS